MSVNGISNQTPIYAGTATAAAKKEIQSDNPAPVSEKGVVYEPTSSETAKGIYKKDTDMVNRLKEDAERRYSQLQDLVRKLLSEQGQAIKDSESIWDKLRTGQVEVDPETAKKAAEEISEDGYWGVKQTSERILSFAKALSGGDPSKAEELRDAFIKGFKEAAKSWGDELPEISKKTYDAVMEKFDTWAKEGQKGTE